MRAYRHRCAICALRERSLIQAAHIVPDIEPRASPPWSTDSRSRIARRTGRIERLEARFARFDHAAA
jgi:ribosomal protein L31